MTTPLVRTLTADLNAKFRATYPYRLNWPDKRPVGAVWLATADARFHSATNPRGWFMDPAVDVTTEAGLRDFRSRLFHAAQVAAAGAKQTNAQGVIVWDIEGQEYPHATSYLGDPRSLPPEMEAAADEFFQVFRLVGLRIGVCIRPQCPTRPAYGDAVTQGDPADYAQVLIEKITYAKNRWGCSLFYIDSNGDPNCPLEESVMQRVHDAHPDVLLIPEHATCRYWVWSAPLRHIARYRRTPDWVRAVYPHSWSFIFTDPHGPAGHEAELVKAVQDGDAILFNAYPDKGHAPAVRDIYERARADA